MKRSVRGTDRSPTSITEFKDEFGCFVHSPGCLMVYIETGLILPFICPRRSSVLQSVGLTAESFVESANSLIAALCIATLGAIHRRFSNPQVRHERWNERLWAADVNCCIATGRNSVHGHTRCLFLCTRISVPLPEIEVA